MKNILVIFILTGCVKLMVGQNLVPNWSFEDTLQCPTSGSIDDALNWSPCGISPDYFNQCVANGELYSVPYNWGGYQQPSSGNAYAALVTYSPFIPNGREFIIAQLAFPLIVGVEYFVSLNVCLSLSDTIIASIATNKMGAKFTMNSHDWSTPPAVDNFAHVYSDSIITDTTNWSTISGSFIADSAYNYIIIGNFFDDLNTNKIIYVDTFFNCAYYYVDDICVSTDSLTCLPAIGIQEISSSTNHKIYPNPASQFATLEFSNLSKDIHFFTLYDTFGRPVVFINNIIADKIEIERQNLPAGLYYFQLRTERKIIANGKLTFN